ncbi:hypothetical protein GCM10012287_18250 [Streptomyces daqingensis]|uniref:Uncharacterized protein n=1 Tax=Streptomyces daqingensis TaxID=1472640 RepID=A0ABQ2M4T5_9ACTN|nr:hypothetical protein [Streptomyces daqingensis]GGO46891.1 hypothetical protein GCM10012287_18250 [Streptomyces daqingensis]
MPAPTTGTGRRRRVPATAPRPGYRKDSDTRVRPDETPDEATECDPEAAAHASATAAEIVRWGTFACALAPLTLLVCGSPLQTVAATAAGLAAVNAACRALLRCSERVYTRQATGRWPAGRPEPHRGRHSRTGTGLHRGGRHTGRT